MSTPVTHLRPLGKVALACREERPADVLALLQGKGSEARDTGGEGGEAGDKGLTTVLVAVRFGIRGRARRDICIGASDNLALFPPHRRERTL